MSLPEESKQNERSQKILLSATTYDHEEQRIYVTEILNILPPQKEQKNKNKKN
jgi:hypothetical protein